MTESKKKVVITGASSERDKEFNCPRARYDAGGVRCPAWVRRPGEPSGGLEKDTEGDPVFPAAAEWWVLAGFGQTASVNASRDDATGLGAGRSALLFECE